MPAMPNGFSVRSLDLAALAEHHIDASRSEQQRRFADGLICLGAFNRKDALIGVIWLGVGAGYEPTLPVRLRLPADAAWDTGLWIPERYRLSRAFTALWAGAGEWLDQRGLTRSFSSIDDYNFRSFLAHKRMGFHSIGTVKYLHIGRWQWVSIPRIGWLTLAIGSHYDWAVQPRSVSSDQRQRAVTGLPLASLAD